MRNLPLDLAEFLSAFNGGDDQVPPSLLSAPIGGIYFAGQRPEVEDVVTRGR